MHLFILNLSTYFLVPLSGKGCHKHEASRMRSTWVGNRYWLSLFTKAPSGGSVARSPDRDRVPHFNAYLVGPLGPHDCPISHYIPTGRC